MKKISILGSTGSIGTQTLDVARNNPDLKITALAAGQNIALLEEQIREFKPSVAAVWDEQAAEDLKVRVRDTDVRVLAGMDGLIEAFARVLARTHVDTAEEEKERRISRDQFSVPRCMAAILRRLNRGQVRFSDLFDEHVTRDEVVSTFLALLELLKAGRASVVQDATYAEILIGPAKPQTHEAAEEGEPDDDGRP